MLQPTVTYLGDIVADLEHRVMGPDTAGGYVRVAEASYDEQACVTRVHFEPITIEAMAAGARFDAYGQCYFVPTEDLA